MSLFEELIEDKAQDKKIVKSFTPKETLSEQIFEDNGKMRDDIKNALLKNHHIRKKNNLIIILNIYFEI